MLRQSSAFVTPPVVKNLIIINALFFLAVAILPNGMGDVLIQKLGLHFWESKSFEAYQIVSYMFLHANLPHLFMNMFALWMFGRALEYDLGSKRFLIYYMVTGIGAALIQLGVNWAEITSMKSQITELGATPYALNHLQRYMENLTTVGASGAVFGVLLAFGMLHPNTMIMLLIPPIPIKAKYFVIIYGVIELSLGVASTGSQIAHFAHVGGMLFGFFLLKFWKKNRTIYF